MKTVNVNLDLNGMFIIPGTIKPNWNSKLKQRIQFIKDNNVGNIRLIMHLNKEHYEWAVIDSYYLPMIDSIMCEYSITDYHYVFNIPKPYKNSNKITYVDYFAMQTYRLVIEKNHPYNTQWNSNSDKGLFLIGKPNKMNRLPILYELYKKDLLDKFEWSLHLNDDVISSIKKSNILDIPENELTTFLEACARNSPDSAKVEFRGSNEDVSVHYSGFPFDADMYKNTLFSLIAETEFNEFGDIFITEKTWRAIVNKHPFIMTSTVNSLKYLKSLGFRTFENYLPVSNYDSIVDTQERLNAIYSNLDSFFSKENIEQINEDVEYNFQHFAKFALGEFSKLEQLYDSNQYELARFLIDYHGYK